jgi:hypothetical protein
MSTELKTNTATRITVGPFLDKTDGITPEVALTATNEKLTLVVDTAGVPTLVLDANATASSGSNDMVHITNDDAGYYDLELTAAQLNYLGNAKLSINYVTDHLPVFHELNIVSAQYWDAKYGSGNLSADVKAITAGVDFSATMKTSIETACDATVGGGTGTALTAIPWNANWDAEVQSEVNDELILQNLDHLAKTATAGVDMTAEVVDGSIISRMISNSDTSLFVPATHSLQIVGAVVNNIHDTDLPDVHTDVGTAITNIGDVHATDLPAAKTVVDAIKVQTDKMAFTVANQIDANVIDWKGAAAPAMTGDAYAEAVLVHAHVADCATATVLGNVHTDVDNILADTNELQVDDYPTSIAAIKAETALIVADTNELQTDDYPTSIAAVKADTAAILTDTGTTLDTLIQDIPTVAEFNARTLVAADYTVVTDTIAAVTAATVTAIGANVITAASIAADAGTEIAAAVWAKTGAVTSIATELLLERLYEMVNNKMIVTEATGAVALRNIADSANVATGVVADLGATTQRDGLTWV